MVGDKGLKKVVTVATFLLPNFLGFLIFIGIPIVASLFISFTSWDLLNPPEFIGLDNYARLIQDPQFLNAFTNTLYFIGGYLPLVMGLSLAVALLLNQTVTFKLFFRGAYFLPVVTSWVAVSLIWMWLLNPSYGLVNYFLSLVGINGPGWLFDPNWAMPGIILTSVWKDIGFIMIIYLAGLQGIPEHYYEAAEIDGANAFQKFRAITLPMLAPTTFFVLVISLINSFQVFDQVMIMTGGGPANSTTVMVQEIYNYAFRYFQMGYGAALSWVLFLFIFIVTFFQMKLQKRWVDHGS